MYSIVVPVEIVTELYHIREREGISMRKQILEAVKKHIKAAKRRSKKPVEIKGMETLVEMGFGRAER